MEIQCNHPLETLQQCMTERNCCFDACLKEDDVKMMAECIRLDRECADMCGYLEQAISRISPFIKALAVVCASMCDAYDEECEKKTMNIAKDVEKHVLNMQRRIIRLCPISPVT
ncbi:hypothetical protein GCM10022378_12000 [Salinicoccus jeotgali]|uniref:Four-helix bundle copper-binding protein n=1 Tax=Salinicoccus jeotgali TaxID=381634 RepID=A0ABP7ETH2_9STAP